MVKEFSSKEIFMELMKNLSFFFLGIIELVEEFEWNISFHMRDNERSRISR